MEVYEIIGELGFPIFSAIVAGYFIFLTLKYILLGVTSSVASTGNIIKRLHQRVTVITHDVARLDIQTCKILGLEPDLERISRLDSVDARKD